MSASDLTPGDVADYWRRWALHAGEAFAAHALCMVLAALDGETRPSELGVGDDLPADVAPWPSSIPLNPHSLEINFGIGWVVARCRCGYFTPECPDRATAIGVWAGHIVDDPLADPPPDPLPLDHPRWPDWSPAYIGQRVRYCGGTKVGPITGIKVEDEIARVWYSPHGGWFRLDEMVRVDEEGWNDE